MTIEQLRSDMVTAMKARDKFRKDSISLLISAIKKVAIDQGIRDDIPEELVDSILLKEAKLAKEQVDTCPDSRQDLKAEYEQRYNIYKEYIPTQLSSEDIEKYILDNFADLVADKNKAMLMKSTISALKNKADGKDINQVVTKLCNQ